MEAIVDLNNSGPDRYKKIIKQYFTVRFVDIICPRLQEKIPTTQKNAQNETIRKLKAKTVCIVVYVQKHFSFE